MNTTLNQCFLEGIISLKACIDSNNRKIQNIYIDKNKVVKRDRKITQFISYLKSANIPYELLSREEIDVIANANDAGNTHGGVVGYVSDRTYLDFDNFLSSLSESGSYAVFLDGIEDPYNFGYAIRNMFAFGTYGFIIPQRNWMECAGVVSKASAGASEFARITVAPNDKNVLDALKKHNIDIVCAAVSNTSVSLYDFNPKKPFVLFIGGEKRGISKDFIENANSIVHIPYKNENAKFSLPAASAAAIFASHLAQKI